MCTSSTSIFSVLAISSTDFSFFAILNTSSCVCNISAWVSALSARSSACSARSFCSCVFWRSACIFIQLLQVNYGETPEFLLLRKTDDIHRYDTKSTVYDTKLILCLLCYNIFYFLSIILNNIYLNTIIWLLFWQADKPLLCALKLDFALTFAHMIFGFSPHLQR